MNSRKGFRIAGGLWIFSSWMMLFTGNGTFAQSLGIVDYDKLVWRSTVIVVASVEPQRVDALLGTGTQLFQLVNPKVWKGEWKPDSRVIMVAGADDSPFGRAANLEARQSYLLFLQRRPESSQRFKQEWGSSLPDVDLLWLDSGWQGVCALSQTAKETRFRDRLAKSYGGAIKPEVFVAAVERFLRTEDTRTDNPEVSQALRLLRLEAPPLPQYPTVVPEVVPSTR